MGVISTMEWIDVNEMLPNAVTENEWYDNEPYIKHCNNLVLAVIRERGISNKNSEEFLRLYVRPVMHIYSEWEKDYVWCGVNSYEEVLFWSEIPNIPNVDYINAQGVVCGRH